MYTGVRTFPMLPEELSTGLTSLNEGVDRLAVVIDMVVAADGAVSSQGIYRAVVRNQAQLTYNGVGPWLEGTAAAPCQGGGFQRIWRLSSSCRTRPRGSCSTNGSGWAL